MAFSFHANTLAFGGQIEEPGRRPKYLSSQASVTLPTEGGVGEATVCDFEQDGISFYRAESRVFGNAFDDRIFTTFANVTVYGLDILGRIQADVLSTSVTSIHERVPGKISESQISFDVNILGLVIDGNPVHVEFDTEPYRRHGTFSAFTDSFMSLSEAEATRLATAYNWPLGECQTVTGGAKSFHVPARAMSGLRASVVRDTTPSLAAGTIPGVTRQGYTIEVAGFGLVHLGEVLLIPGRRSISALRVELGKTLGPVMPRASLAVPDGEPRIHAVGLTETVAESASLATAGGGYTVARTEGNGTDYGFP
jgi:hypothetical protein